MLVKRGTVLGMETIPTTIQEAHEVTAECLANCEALYDDWFNSDEPIDWWLFYDRLESMYGWSITQTDSPASKKIQRHVRKHRNQ